MSNPWFLVVVDCAVVDVAAAAPRFVARAAAAAVVAASRADADVLTAARHDSAAPAQSFAAPRAPPPTYSHYAVTLAKNAGYAPACQPTRQMRGSNAYC